jgi:hydrogenase maturation protein HypF
LRQRCGLHLLGTVQGIGLRPLVYRLSQKYDLTGWVQNTADNVTLEWQGDSLQLENALSELQSQLSHLDHRIFEKHPQSLQIENDFTILPSQGQSEMHSVISPDLCTCIQCIAELFDPSNRRFGYAFISCAQCGPRYTLCEKLPYDRHHTSLSKFPLCVNCQHEYNNPIDRRFHAQTINCWDCGPKLWLADRNNTILATQHDAIHATLARLKAGNIVAVKGIGGFHLIALATHSDALARLRLRKNRPDKPFALMVKNSEQAKLYCEISELENELLHCAAAPIVLLRKKNSSSMPLSPNIAPRQNNYGVMLAYTPLHHLLLDALASPLVATSANSHNEPICYDNTEAFDNLHSIADYWLCHDRDIIHPLEDSVVQSVNHKIQFIRRARGYIPFTLSAPTTPKTVLAVGGHLKNTLALHSKNRLYISPYIGDLDSMKCIKRFQSELNGLQSLHRPDLIACDVHPDYASTQESHLLKTPVQSVQHHIAHVFAVAGEHALSAPYLGFAWDGMGLGLDGTFWGSECFLIETHAIKRIASCFPIVLPGGEKAIKEPRRVAASMLYTLFHNLDRCAHFTQDEKPLFEELLNNRNFSPLCSSMGRLFDGIACLLGGPPKMTFEGQAAMHIQQLAEQYTGPVTPYEVTLSYTDGLIVIDWRPLLQLILDDLKRYVEPAKIAKQFHHWCAEAICKIASQFKWHHIVLSGGVFQNKLLTELAVSRLQCAGYSVYCAEHFPPNDGGLSVGQAFAIQHLSSCV